MAKDGEAARAEAILAAGRICGERNERLTRLRRIVLEILLERDGPLKAYEILEALRDAGRRVPPATVYRILEFLLAQGFVHRVNALNAYVACSGGHAGRRQLLLVCSVCRKTSEIVDPAFYRSLLGKLGELGFSLAGGGVEIQGICPCCVHA
ncbi:MAG: transcriptional repressor [Desulfovibrio sp.]|jgi:Fur family zinc uptake transcriptional regulator|nr:transcriptional repressor [Desulfovibrio sp.]